MNPERDPSISSLCALCICEFHALLASIPNEKAETRLKVQDDLGRLRVWIGNFGAHRKQTDRLSLDHRLREAPELHQEVRNHINDISEAIRGAISLVQESEKSFGVEETPPSSETNDLESDDSDSDGFWDQIKAENEKHSKLDEYLHDIQYTVTSLYKFSLTLQNPAHRDRTVQASRIDLDHFEFYDIQHVSEKFNIPRESMLAQRLGKANTKRRQLLAYHKNHAGKISKYVDVAMDKAVKMAKDQIEHNDRAESSKGPLSISTKWTQDTTVSTINHQDIDVASNSGHTQFSVTTSMAGDQAHDLMPPPPPPPAADVVNTVQNFIFFCPYCRQTIQLENVDEDWKYHVLSDLRPYICTFGNCVKANQLYDSYTEWSEHEQQFHRREWFCRSCISTYQSEASFWNHLEDAHGEALPKDQRRVMVKLSERPTSSAQQCPLCTKPPISNPRRFQQHLARHLQQLSLFVLPLPESNENEHPTREEESNESQKALMLDGEARQSLNSTSTNQESSPIQKSPPLSEGSSSHDQLEVPEVQNRRGFQDREVKEHQKLEDNERTMRLEHPSTLINMANLESISQLLGPSQEAENLEGEVLETHETMLADDHPDKLTSIASLASIYRHQGRWEEAERLEVQLMETYKTKLGEDHSDTLRSVANLGLLYSGQGNLREAEEMFQRALVGYEKALGPDHTTTLQIVDNLGDLYSDQGKLQEAEAAYQRALVGYEKALGPDHTTTLQIVDNLGDLYLNQGKLQEAEAAYQRALAGYEKALGPDETPTLRIVNNLGDLYYYQGKLQEAEAAYQRALAGYEKALGPDHTSTLQTVNSIGILYSDQGRLREAEEMYQRALAGYEKIFGPDHGKTRRLAKRLNTLRNADVK